MGCGQWAGTCSLDFGEAGVADGDELAAAAALSPRVAAGEVGVAGEVGAVGVVGDSCFWTAGGSLAAGAGTTGSGGGTAIEFFCPNTEHENSGSVPCDDLQA